MSNHPLSIVLGRILVTCVCVGGGGERGGSMQWVTKG